MFHCGIWCTLRLAICEGCDVHPWDIRVPLALFTVHHCVALGCLTGGVCSNKATDCVVGGFAARTTGAGVRAASDCSNWCTLRLAICEDWRIHLWDIAVLPAL